MSRIAHSQGENLSTDGEVAIQAHVEYPIPSYCEGYLQRDTASSWDQLVLAVIAAMIIAVTRLPWGQLCIENGRQHLSFCHDCGDPALGGSDRRGNADIVLFPLEESQTSACPPQSVKGTLQVTRGWRIRPEGGSLDRIWLSLGGG